MHAHSFDDLQLPFEDLAPARHAAEAPRGWTNSKLRPKSIGLHHCAGWEMVGLSLALVCSAWDGRSCSVLRCSHSSRWIRHLINASTGRKVTRCTPPSARQPIASTALARGGTRCDSSLSIPSQTNRRDPSMQACGVEADEEWYLFAPSTTHVVGFPNPRSDLPCRRSMKRR
jgi:hypothetical protein